MNQNQNTENKNKKKITAKQIAAIIGVILLVLLYLVTLVVAFVDKSASGKLFGICLIATFTIPLLLWVYIWMYGKMTGKSTMADLNIGGDDHVTDEEVREILIQQALAEADNASDNDTE